MNTPSHAILNLAFLSRPGMALPIAVGGVLPDAPIFVMYIWAKLIRRQSEQTIWAETYYQPFWQNITALFHSFPITLIAAILCHSLAWQTGEILCFSMVLHALLDFPVHHDDAHRHFFPFSDYRFISPVSYWDPRHYGAIASVVEQMLVLGATLYLFTGPVSGMGVVLLVLVNGLYLGSTLVFRVIRPVVRRFRTTDA